MSAIEYNNLLFEISQRFDELNVHSRLLFMCRGKLASGSEDNIQDALSLFKELEEQNNLGADRLEVIKGLLKSFKEWSLFGKVRKLESKRKKYNELLEVIIGALDELNDVERLISMCRGKISEESEGNIQDVRSLIKELVSQNILGYDRLDILKGILNEIEKSDLVKEVEEFEEQRNQEDEIERKEDEFERRKAQAAAVMSSVGNTLIGGCSTKTSNKDGMGLFRIPAVIHNQGEEYKKLTEERRNAWISAISRGDISCKDISKTERVCGRHFISEAFYAVG